MQLFNGPAKRFNPLLQILYDGHNRFQLRFAQIENLLSRQLGGTPLPPPTTKSILKRVQVPNIILYLYES